MKTPVSFLFAFFLAVAAGAATFQWSIPTDLKEIVIFKLDGRGGCAFWGQTTNGFFRVMYIDKKGREVYNQLAPLPVYGLTCTRKGIVYSYQNGPRYESVFVDNKGQATQIADPDAHLAVIYSIAPSNENADKKGFFLLKAETSGTQHYTVQRYKYK
jgi:hypothetical protein